MGNIIEEARRRREQQLNQEALAQKIKLNEELEKQKHIQETIIFNQNYFANVKIALVDSGIILTLVEQAKIRDASVNLYGMHMNSDPSPLDSWYKRQYDYKDGRSIIDKAKIIMSWSKGYKSKNLENGSSLQDATFYHIGITYHFDDSLEFELGIGETLKQPKSVNNIIDHEDNLTGTYVKSLTSQEWKDENHLARILELTINNPVIKHKEWIFVLPQQYTGSSTW
jgi:hypothetical protein